MKPILLLITLMGLLTGCATNPYAKFYQDTTQRLTASQMERLLPPSPNPQIIAIPPTEKEAQVRAFKEKGFVPIGFAAFRGGRPTQSGLLEQAKKVGADVVLYSSYYSHTERGMEAVTRYEPGKMYTTAQYGTATASVYGGRYNTYGFGSYSGYTTTTTPSTVHTDYVPYENRIYEHQASFWRRGKRGVFGAFFKPIPDDLRIKLHRNTGAYVDVVVMDGAAYKANVMRGDIIIQIEDKPVSTVPEVLSVLRSYAGRKIMVKVIRDNSSIDLNVQLDPAI